MVKFYLQPRLNKKDVHHPITEPQETVKLLEEKKILLQRLLNQRSSVLIGM